jgi:hypothetical protein
VYGPPTGTRIIVDVPRSNVLELTNPSVDVVIRRLDFYSSDATLGGMFSAAVITGGKVKFEDCVFRARSQHAAAVQIEGTHAGFSCEFADCEFHEPLGPTNRSGCVNIGGCGQVTMTRCKFSGGKRASALLIRHEHAKKGGKKGDAGTAPLNVRLADCTFDGDAVDMAVKGTPPPSQSVLDGHNESGADAISGAGVVSRGGSSFRSTLEMDNCTVQGSPHSTNGTGVCAQGDGWGVCIRKCSFSTLSDCALRLSGRLLVNVSGCTIKSCRSGMIAEIDDSGGGGGLTLVDNTISDVDVVGIQLRGAEHYFVNPSSHLWRVVR